MDFSRFTKTVVATNEARTKKRTTKPVDKTIRAVYTNNKWYASVDGKHIPILDDDTDIGKYMILFRRSDWKKAIMYALLKPERVEQVREHWEAFCPGVELEGVITNNQFHVTNVNTDNIKRR